MFKTRTRMVSFRLSEDEYERLKDLSLMECARSVSDFARATLCRLPEGKGNVLEATSPRVDKLEGAVKQLAYDMNSLRQFVEASLGVVPARAKAAAAQENNQ